MGMQIKYVILLGMDNYVICCIDFQLFLTHAGRVVGKRTRKCIFQTTFDLISE